MKENRNRNNNKHKELSCDEEKDEDVECHTMFQDNESSAVVKNDKRHKSKAIENCVDECDHEEACNVVECKCDFKKERQAVEDVKPINNMLQEKKDQAARQRIAVGYDQYGLNQYLSDLIPVRRRLPDVRSAWCRDMARLVTRLPNQHHHHSS